PFAFAAYRATNLLSGACIVDRPQQGEQRAIERHRHAMPVAGCNNRASERLDLEPTSGEAIEIHRGAELAGKITQRGDRARGFVIGELDALGARRSDRFVEGAPA